MHRPSSRLIGLGVLPALFLGVFFGWPIAAVLARGLTGGALDRLFEARTFDLLWFTTWQAGLSTLLTFVIGLPGAWALSRPFRGAALFRAGMTVAFVLPTVVVAAAFDSLGRTGLVPWSPRGLAAVLGAHVFFNYAVVARVVGAAWSRVPEEAREMSRSLGQGPASTFFRVDLPLLRPALAAAASIVFLFTFTSFGVVLILGGFTLNTLEVEIWRRTLHLLDFDGAAALALLQMAAVIAGLVAWTRFQRGVASDTGPQQSPAPFRWWVRTMALLPGLLVVGVPVAVLVWRSLSTESGLAFTWFRTLGTQRRGLTDFVSPGAAIANSLGFAAAATSVALLVGGIASLAISRRQRRSSTRALDAALMLPLGTSAVTLGFGMLLAFDSAPLDLRGQALVVPLAHALVGIPFVVRTIVPALRALPPGFHEAAQTLGLGAARARLRIDLPLVSPAVAVGASFAAAVSLGEFGATTFLSRPDSATVPIALFRLLGRPGAVNQGQAYALAVILMGLVALVVLVAGAADAAASGRQRG